MSQPKLFSLIDKAVYDYKLIEKGDRILIGASGGKDSTALVEYFANRLKRKTDDFSFTAIHIETDFEGCISTTCTFMYHDNSGRKDVLEGNSSTSAKSFSEIL